MLLFDNYSVDNKNCSFLKKKRTFLLEIMKLTPFKNVSIFNIDEKNVINYNNFFSLFLCKSWVKFTNYYININLLNINKIIQ